MGQVCTLDIIGLFQEALVVIQSKEQATQSGSSSTTQKQESLRTRKYRCIMVHHLKAKTQPVGAARICFCTKVKIWNEMPFFLVNNVFIFDFQKFKVN